MITQMELSKNKEISKLFFSRCQIGLETYPPFKCPGGYAILRRRLKLNSKISAVRYKKNKFNGTS